MPDKTPWRRLVVGERVRGKGGLVWMIERLHRADGHADITLRRDDETKQLTRPETEGVEVVPLAADLSDAENIMRVHTAPAGEFDVFPDASKYGASTMLAHLKIVHGIDVADVEKPFTRHIEAHGAGDAGHGHGAPAAEPAVEPAPVVEPVAVEAPATPAGRWPANVILDTDMASELDEQSGQLTSGKLLPHHADHGKQAGTLGAFDGAPGRESYGDTGGASRFFTTVPADDDSAAPAAYLDGAVRVYGGDCLDVLRELPDNSVDAVVTDPPYGLTEHRRANVEKALLAWLTGDREHVPNGRGFMGRDWDAFVPPPAVWDECFRVLKPGGHLLAFCGSRTIDLMMMSIRLAGLTEQAAPEIRDSIAWLYGSGFPKSLDVGKAIDKAAGATREVTGRYQPPNGQAWNLAHDVAGTEVGTIGHTSRAASLDVTAPATDAARQWDGWGTALKPAFEPIVVARKPLASGTVAANVQQWGTGALNIAATRVATSDDLNGGTYRGGSPDAGTGGGWGMRNGAREYVAPAGRWPANVALDGTQADVLDAATGNLSVNGPATYRRDKADAVKDRSSYVVDREGGDIRPGYGDSGGASRFFPTFRDESLPTMKYQAKAPTSERPSYWRDSCGCDDAWPVPAIKVHPLPDEWDKGTECGACGKPAKKVAHPTVKPLALMRWLVKLVTPPGGVVLDPFAGSGTTAEACILEGFASIIIERDPDSMPLIEQRIGRHLPATNASSDDDGDAA
jgi:DNA modification methylase